MLSTGHGPLVVGGGAGLSVLLCKSTGKVNRCWCRILRVHFSFFPLAILSSCAKNATAMQWVTDNALAWAEMKSKEELLCGLMFLGFFCSAVAQACMVL